jgi:hypothetical protein
MKRPFDRKFISPRSADVFLEKILAAPIGFRLLTKFEIAPRGWTMKSEF